MATDTTSAHFHMSLATLPPTVVPIEWQRYQLAEHLQSDTSKPEQQPNCCIDANQSAGEEQQAKRHAGGEQPLNEWVVFGLSLLNVLGFAGMVIARTWAGHSLAATTSEFSVPLTPDESVEQVAWTIGALTLLGFLMWPFIPRLSTASRQNDIKHLTLPLVLACISHALASVFWSYRFLTLSAIMSATVFAELMLVCVTIVRAPLLFRLPFGLWFGWSSITFLHQASAAMYHEWSLDFFASSWWSLAALLSVIAVAFTWGSLAGESDPSFQAAVSLACFAIAHRTEQYSLPIVSHAAYVCAILAAGHALICLILVLSERKPTKNEAEPKEECRDEEVALLVGTDKMDSDAIPSAPYLALPVHEQAIPIIYEHVPYYPMPPPASLVYPAVAAHPVTSPPDEKREQPTITTTSNQVNVKQ